MTDKKEKLDPCGNPIKRKDAPLKLTPEEYRKRREWVKNSSKLHLDTMLYRATRSEGGNRIHVPINVSLSRKVI